MFKFLKFMRKTVAVITVFAIIFCGFVFVDFTANAGRFPDEYEDFLTRMGERESHNNYGVVGGGGTYYGRWQTSVGPIINCGLMNADGSWTSLANAYGVYSMDDYLQSAEAQYYNVYTYHRGVWQSICKLGAEQYLGTYIRGVYVNVAGIVGMSHEYGYGNTIQFLREAGDGWDTALKLFDYYNDFDITESITGTAAVLSPDPEYPVITDVEFEDISGQSFTVVIRATDNKGISGACVAAWSTENGQDDIIWYSAPQCGDCYKATVYTENHGGQTGDYCVYVGVRDLADNLSECGFDISLPDFYCTSCIDVAADDGQRVDGNILTAGWCFCKNYPDTKFYLEIDGEKSLISKGGRSDVKAAYSLSFEDVGFSTYIDVTSLSMGKHNYKIYAENSFGIPFVILNRSFILINAYKKSTVKDKRYDFYFYESNYSYAEAVSFCEANGYTLAEITDETESIIKQNCDGNYMCGNGVINADGKTDETSVKGFIARYDKAFLDVKTTEIKLAVGKTADIKYEVCPNAGTQFITDNAEICTVSSLGTVTAVSHGTTYIHIINGEFEATVSVICVDPNPDIIPSETGDVNGDTFVDATDLVRLKKYLAGQKVTVYGGADLTNDGVIDATDLIRLKKRLANGTVKS